MSILKGAGSERDRGPRAGQAFRGQDRCERCLDVGDRRRDSSGFLGPNGSGKTTTIRVMCGLLTPDEGEGTVLAMISARDSSVFKREVGYMTQRFSFYEDLSIEENLDFVARLYDLDPVSAVVRDTLEDLGLFTAASATGRPRSPAAGSSAWRLPPASCTSRSCCCWTSPRQGSTRRHGASSGTRSTNAPLTG
jgi:ABC-2 type transport system ATP-binding protein